MEYPDDDYNGPNASAGLPPPTDHYIQKDKGDVAEGPKKATNGARAFGVAMIILGILMFGVSIPFLSDQENYGNIRKGLQSSGTDFADDLLLPFYIVAGGPIAIIAGFLGIFSYYTNNKFIGYIAMVLSFVAAAIPIWASTQVESILSATLLKLQSNPVAEHFTDGEKKLLDFVSVAFNECCMTEYDSRNYGGIQNHSLIDPTNDTPVDDNQRPVNMCGATIDDTCPPTGANKMFPDLIDQAIDLVHSDPPLNVILCACYTDNQQYQKINAALDENGLCDKYRKIIVDKADSRKVPTTSLTFGTLITTLHQLRPLYTLPIGKFAMVGKMLPGPSTYGEAAEPIGYSCGLGYAKGMGYQMYLYIDDDVKIIRLGGLVLGITYAICPVVLFLYWLSGGGSGEEEEFVAYEDYPEKV